MRGRGKGRSGKGQSLSLTVRLEPVFRFAFELFCLRRAWRSGPAADRPSLQDSTQGGDSPRTAPARVSLAGFVPGFMRVAPFQGSGASKWSEISPRAFRPLFASRRAPVARVPVPSGSLPEPCKGVHSQEKPRVQASSASETANPGLRRSPKPQS